MDSEKHSFRVYLSSDSSFTYHPKNTKAEFGVHLANAIKLKGHWEVAISQIITTTLAAADSSPVFVYSNISEKIYLADKKARCLRILPPLSTTGVNSFQFENLSYERVEFPEIQDIVIYFKSREGEPYNLSSTGPPSIVGLHFRPSRENE